MLLHLQQPCIQVEVGIGPCLLPESEDAQQALVKAPAPQRCKAAWTRIAAHVVGHLPAAAEHARTSHQRERAQRMQAASTPADLRTKSCAAASKSLLMLTDGVQQRFICDQQMPGIKQNAWKHDFKCRARARHERH